MSEIRIIKFGRSVAFRLLDTVHLYDRLSSVLVVICFLSLGAKLSDAANFTLGGNDPFKCNPSGNVNCRGFRSTDGYLALSHNVTEGNSIGIELHTYGTVLKDMPLLFNPVTKLWYSFKTSFQFMIEAGENGPGDGMTFVMLNVSQYLGTSLHDFALYDDSGRAVVASLAVEFDTHQNGGDTSDNHVGLDTESLPSIVARNASDVGITLWGGKRVYSWIDYDSSSQNLEVRISPNNSRPVDAFLQHKVNLSEVFRGISEVLYVGFTASNGDLNCSCYNSYYIYDWNFEQFSIPAETDPPSAVPSPAETDPPSAVPSPSSPTGDPQSQAGTIAGATIGSIVVLILLGFLLLLWWKRRSEADSAPKLQKLKENAELAGISDNLRYNYKQLSVATGQFREESKLGQGGFGSVYRGVLPSTGVVVAVKKVSHDSKQGLREFVAEVTIISQLRHRNIVRLLGWCSDNNKFLLVYEFMPNGSLDKALFHPVQDSVLSWKRRFQIIVGAAEALHYLHEGWRQQIIHRDFKSSNIMLDENFNAMLGDFGLARMVDHHGDPATTMVAGTFGYIAPEAPASGKFTEKTDVFAFGAVALEVACGRISYNFQLPEEERVLVDWVWKKLDEDKLMSVVDPRLEGQYDSQQAQVLLLLGLLCSHPNPNDRPSMRHVLEVLAGDVSMPPVPLSKPAAEYHLSGRQFRMEALRLISETDTMSEMDTETIESSDRSLLHRSDPLIIFANSSTDSTASAPVSNPVRM